MNIRDNSSITPVSRVGNEVPLTVEGARTQATSVETRMHTGL